MSSRSISPRVPIRRSQATLADPFQPIAIINTTPLIDLMLVLLIMFIVTVPIATHKVPLDLPAPPPDRPVPPPPVHRLGLDSAGRLSWDGVAIADAALRPRLRAVATDPARPDLHIAVDPEARFERVDQLLAQVKRAGVTRLGFVGHHRFVTALSAS